MVGFFHDIVYRAHWLLCYTLHSGNRSKYNQMDCHEVRALSIITWVKEKVNGKRDSHAAQGKVSSPQDFVRGQDTPPDRKFERHPEAQRRFNSCAEACLRSDLKGGKVEKQHCSACGKFCWHNPYGNKDKKGFRCTFCGNPVGTGPKRDRTLPVHEAQVAKARKERGF